MKLFRKSRRKRELREQSNNRRYLIPDPKTDKFFLNAVVLPWHSSGMANEFSEFTKQRNNNIANLQNNETTKQRKTK